MKNKSIFKKSIFKKWWFWVIIVVVIYAIGSSGADKSDTLETATIKTDTTAVNTTETATIETTVVEEKVITPDLIVTAGEILEVFDANEIKGKQTYTDKFAEITGVVGTVGEVLGSTYVTLGTGADFELITLQCFFKDKDEINKLAEINKGDTITVLGTIGEKSINISVDDCTFK